MSLSFPALLSLLLVPALLGAGLLRLQGVGARTDPLAFFGWCWLQGSLGVAIVLSGWLWLGLPLQAPALAATLLIVGAVAFALGRRVPLAEATPSETRAFPRWERVTFAVVLVFLLVVACDRILIAGSRAIVHSDEAYIWAAKAKAIFGAGGFGARFAEIMQAPAVVSHKDYPPLNPLLQVWAFAHAGAIVHVENRLPLQMFGIAYILVVASALRRRARPLVAALFLAALGLVAFTRFSLAHAFSDLLVAFGLFVACDLWQRWEEDGRVLWLGLLGTSLPLLVWSKNEGIMLVLAGGVAWLVASALGRARWPGFRAHPRRLALLAPLLLSILYLAWFNKHFGFQNDLFGEGALESEDGVPAGVPGAGYLARAMASEPGTIRTIVAHFGGLIAAHYTHYLLLAFLVLVLVAPKRALARGNASLTLVLLFALAGYMAVYLGTPWEVQQHLTKSAHRLVHHLVPSAGLWILLFVLAELPWARARHAQGSTAGVP